MELFLFLFLQHYMKSKIKLWQIIALSAFIMLLMLGPTIGAITEFGPVEAEKLRYPAFSQWRLVSIGKYFEHVDFFAIFQWMSGAFVRISLGLVLIMELIPLRGRKGRLWFVMLASVVYVTVAKLLAPRMIQAELVIRAVFLVDLAIAVLVTTTIWLLSFSGSRRGGNKINASIPPTTTESAPRITCDWLHERLDRCGDVTIKGVVRHGNDASETMHYVVVYVPGMVDFKFMQTLFGSDGSLAFDEKTNPLVQPVSAEDDGEHIFEQLFAGQLILLHEASGGVFAIDSPGQPSRSIEESTLELSVKGPRDGFVEAISGELVARPKAAPHA